MSRPPRYHRLSVAFFAVLLAACTGAPAEMPLPAPSPAARPTFPATAAGLPSPSPSPSPSPAIVPALRLVNGRYTVRSGDSLSVIAAMFDTTVGAIVRANELDDPNDIVAGQRLIIPGASPSPAPRPSR